MKVTVTEGIATFLGVIGMWAFLFFLYKFIKKPTSQNLIYMVADFVFFNGCAIISVREKTHQYNIERKNGEDK